MIFLASAHQNKGQERKAKGAIGKRRGGVERKVGEGLNWHISEGSGAACGPKAAEGGGWRQGRDQQQLCGSKITVYLFEAEEEVGGVDGAQLAGIVAGAAPLAANALEAAHPVLYRKIKNGNRAYSLAHYQRQRAGG